MMGSAAQEIVVERLFDTYASFMRDQLNASQPLA